MESTIKTKSVEESYKEFYAHLRYSTFWKRLYAGIIDGVFIYAISYVLLRLISEGINNYTFVFFTFLPFLYSIGMHSYNGQTFGKMAVGVQVTNSKNESSITYIQALLRDLVPIICLTALVIMSLNAPEVETLEDMEIHKDFFFMLSVLGVTRTIWFILEFATMLLNKKRRALHDYIAGTVVVRT